MKFGLWFESAAEQESWLNALHGKQDAPSAEPPKIQFDSFKREQENDEDDSNELLIEEEQVARVETMQNFGLVVKHMQSIEGSPELAALRKEIASLMR